MSTQVKFSCVFDVTDFSLSCSIDSCNWWICNWDLRNVIHPDLGDIVEEWMAG